MIAVGTFGGGTWTDMKVRPPDAPKTGPFLPRLIPLRIFKVSDGSKVSSVGSFPGGFLHQDQFACRSRTAGQSLFLDASAISESRQWSCETSSSVVGAVRQAGSIELSGDGREAAVSYPDGVKLFDLV